MLLVFPPEFLDKEGDETAVEILTTEMGITRGGLDLEDTVFNSQ